MTRRAWDGKPMIMDACVLIDFIKSDCALFKLVSLYVGALHVTSFMLDEIEDVENQSEFEELGLVVLEPHAEDVFSAGYPGGPTSFQDRVCMLTAKRNGLICVTNDKSLRSLCTAEGVPILWGLELIAELRRVRGISGKESIKIAQAIRKCNPTHINDEILSRFTELIRKGSTRSGGDQIMRAHENKKVMK